MTLEKVITDINLLKANAYPETRLTEWVEELENYVIENVFNKSESYDIEPVKYDWELEPDAELLIPEPYSEIYIHYLSAKIDYWDKEMDSYNNSIAIYNAAYQNFAAHMRREHKPKSKPNRKIMLH